MDVISRKEAQTRGLIRYFTGVPCKQGHLAQWYTSSGQCMECSKISSVIRGAAYRARPEIRERINAYQATYRTQPGVKEWQKAYQAAYRTRPEFKEWRTNYTATYRTRPEIRERDNIRTAAWDKAHPERKKAHNHTRRTRRAGNGGQYTFDEWISVLESQNYRCNNPYCGIDITDLSKQSPDHIVPISKGGTSNIDNIQGLCWTCNIRKGNRDWETFLEAEAQGKRRMA